MKEDNIKEMDKILRSKLSEFEGRPSSSVEERIMKEIKATQKDNTLKFSLGSKKNILKYSIAASFLLVLLSVIFLLVKESNTENTLTNTHTNEKEAEATNQLPGTDLDSKKKGKAGELKTDLVKFKTKDKIITIYLPDSSKVYINKNSNLSYLASSFESGKRLVQLSGEAYFNIMPNPEKPFIIHSDKSIIEVLGTSFNLKSIPNSEAVIVEEGKVSLVRKSDPKSELILTQGKKGYIDSKGQLKKTKATNPNELSWKTKKLIFTKTPMEEVVKEIEKYFSIDIEIAEPKILNCKYTGVFENPTKENVLKIISLSINGTYQEENNVYKLMGKGCK